MKLSESIEKEFVDSIVEMLKEKREEHPNALIFNGDRYATNETGFLQVAMFMKSHIFPSDSWKKNEKMVALAEQINDDLKKECKAKIEQKEVSERTYEENKYIDDLDELISYFKYWIDVAYYINKSHK